MSYVRGCPARQELTSEDAVGETGRDSEQRADG